MRLHLGVGNDYVLETIEMSATTSPEPFIDLELNYQSDHWPANMACFISSAV